MKKKILILIPILAVIFLTTGMLLLTRLQTPAWKTKLNQYLSYLQQTGQASHRVISTSTAASPAKFTPAMSAESYGDNVIFQTSHTSLTEYTAGLKLLPYPPDQVVCALLDVNGQQQLVFIALHNDLYNAEWIVHISPEPWGSSTLQTHLNALGCSLDT